MVDTSAPQRWNAQHFQRMPGLSRKLRMAEVEELPNICRALLEVHTHPNRHGGKNIAASTTFATSPSAPSATGPS